MKDSIGYTLPENTSVKVLCLCVYSDSGLVLKAIHLPKANGQDQEVTLEQLQVFRVICCFSIPDSLGWPFKLYKWTAHLLSFNRTSHQSLPWRCPRKRYNVYQWKHTYTNMQTYMNIHTIPILSPWQLERVEDTSNETESFHTFFPHDRSRMERAL